MVTYEPGKTNEIKVFLDKRRVGSIFKLADNQFVYQPGKSVASRGDVLPSLVAVKRSIEG